jgi:hypothetical protein
MKQYQQCLRLNPSMIAERISHYRIVSKLGAGGMGEGYQAQDTNSIATLRVRSCGPSTTKSAI